MYVWPDDEDVLWMAEAKIVEEVFPDDKGKISDSPVTTTVTSEQTAAQSENTIVVDVQPRFKVNSMVKARYEGRVYIGKMTDHNQNNNQYLINFMIKRPFSVYGLMMRTFFGWQRPRLLRRSF